MDEPIFHPKTRADIDTFLQAPTHAICLVGLPGAGKSFVANYLSQQLVGSSEDAIHIIKPQPRSISIENIRDLQHFLRLKKPGHSEIKRVVIIENAETMGDEAQNALLKTLEEPPADTIFILTTDGSSTLKPTIYSRVRRIQVMPLSLIQAKETYGDAPKLVKAYHLSGGQIGLLRSLLNEANDELVAAVDEAKRLLRSTPFERLILVDRLAKEKTTIPVLLYALERVTSAAMVQAKSPDNLSRMVRNLRHLYQAKVDFARSANAKLLLTDLFLNL